MSAPVLKGPRQHTNKKASAEDAQESDDNSSTLGLRSCDDESCNEWQERNAGRHQPQQIRRPYLANHQRPVQHWASPAGRPSTTGLRRNAKATPRRPVWCKPLLDGTALLESGVPTSGLT